MTDNFNLQKSNLLIKNLRCETKSKFDSLLKAALFKRSESKSTRPEFIRSTERLIENDVGEVDANVKKNIQETDGNISYLINKLSDNEDVKFHKPPVPKPRKSKMGKIKTVEETASVSTISTGTYKVVPETNDSDSAKTFIKTSPKIIKPKSNRVSAQDLPGEGDNKLNQDIEIIGDVVIHDSPSSRSGIIKKRSKNKSESSETSDNTYKTSSKYEPSNNKSDEDVEKEVNEIKPKTKVIKPKIKRNANDDNKNKTEEAGKIDQNAKICENIVGITIHKSGKLRMDSLLIMHPVVKVHIMDSETGKYLKKSDSKRHVVYYYENTDLNYIGPIMTRPYHLKEMHTLCPEWEETIIVNEDYNYLTHVSNHVVIFFEILDFMSVAAIKNQSRMKNNSSTGWHKMAWAFLKIVGQNGTLNTNKMARLQLYVPVKHKIKQADCDVYEWWKSKKWIKYPSTLYVTVKNILPPQKVIETMRSRTPLEKEIGTSILFDEKSTGNQLVNVKSELPLKGISLLENNKKKETLWNRLKFQTCELPNKCIANLHTYDEGSIVFKFSNYGLHLATSVLIDDIYAILIYSVKNFDEVCKFSAHQKIIYSISWSKEDELIISSSADGTVNIWNFIKRSFVQMLPHPSYLYAGEISTTNIIATGCYDSLIRIWTQVSENNGKTSYVLSQELEYHEGYITSLCFNRNSTRLYSADSLGLILEWTVSTCDYNSCCELKRKIILADMIGVIVNQILLHTRETKLIIHARDSTIRIVDLKTEYVIHCLQGAINNRVQTCCTLSPCGTFILSGGENCVVNVWNFDTGKFVAVYFPWGTNNTFTIHCVQFHPHDNMIAFGHHGKKIPILLCTYDPHPVESKIELRFVNNDYERAYNNTADRNEIAIVPPKVQRRKSDINHENMKIHFKHILQKIDTIILPQENDNENKDQN